MMDFEEFRANVAENIREYLPEKYADAEISLQNVIKNNDTRLTGVVIKTEDSSIAPNIYLEGYYEQYSDGRGMEDILEAIADARINSEVPKDIDIGIIGSFEQIRDRIKCRLVNAEMNAAYLADKPHAMIEDLAVLYSVDLGKDSGGHGMSAPITESLMERYGITADELHDIALANLAQKEPVFTSMRDVMIGMMFPDGIPADDPIAMMMLPPEDALPLFVLTNEEKTEGAAMLLDAKTMNGISEKLGGDFIVLPSSIHETIIMPINDGMDRQTLENMVREINAEQLAPEERLSNHAYQYDSIGHELVRMDKMEERTKQRHEMLDGAKRGEKAERTDKKPEKERVSMKERIPEKKAEAAKSETERDKTVPSKTRAAGRE